MLMLLKAKRMCELFRKEKEAPRLTTHREYIIHKWGTAAKTAHSGTRRKLLRLHHGKERESLWESANYLRDWMEKRPCHMLCSLQCLVPRAESATQKTVSKICNKRSLNSMGNCDQHWFIMVAILVLSFYLREIMRVSSKREYNWTTQNSPRDWEICRMNISPDHAVTTTALY